MSEGLKMKYYVLNPTKDSIYGHASRLAICAYAEALRPEDPKLADDLTLWVGELLAGLAVRLMESGQAPASMEEVEDGLAD